MLHFRPRVAVLFFGLSRSASITASSINENILNHSKNKEIEFKCFSSLNFIERVISRRSGERNVVLNKYDIDTIPCLWNLFLQQNDDYIKNELESVKKQPDYYENDYNSNRFLLHQLRSLKAGYKVLSSGLFGEFDFFLFLRPDLLYLDPIDVGEFVSSDPGPLSIRLPSWHAWGGLNDRFAIASPTAAAAYAMRIENVLRYCGTMPLHAERLLAFSLRSAGASVSHMAARACRVRATGEVVSEDFTKGGPLRLEPRVRKAD